MAQVPNYTVEDSTGAALLVQLTDLFKAVQSLNSGVSAPQDLVPGMLWLDSTSGLDLKMRNASNTAWLSFLEALGVTATLAQLNQLTGISNLSLNLVPPGAVAFFARSTAPAGWIKSNGANTLSRTLYSDLFSAIGTTFGAGDGSTTFGVPDLRAEFIRGWDDGRGVDTSRVFGSAQLDQMQKITGSFRIHGDASTPVAGAFSITRDVNVATWGTGSGDTDQVTFDSATSPNARVSSTTSGETRARNVALLACIKY